MFRITLIGMVCLCAATSQSFAQTRFETQYQGRMLIDSNELFHRKQTPSYRLISDQQRENRIDNVLIRSQSPDEARDDVTSVEQSLENILNRPDLMEIPEVHTLTERLQAAESELEEWRSWSQQVSVNNHYHNANYSSYYQDEGGMGGGGGPGGGDMGDVATQSQNPVGGLWMLWFQNDMKVMEGPGDGKRIFNTTVFQPVMPVQLTEEWKLINRPVFTVNTFETPNPFNFSPNFNFTGPASADPFSTDFGLGDTMLIQWLSNTPSDSKMTFGVGWNWMFPTASNDDLGTGKTSVGPSVVAIYLGDKIITGGILQQYYSIGGDDSRSRVSLMDFQYVFRYRFTPLTSVGFAPNMQWDQVTGKVTMPVGVGVDTMAFLGKMPLRMGAELQYYPSHERGNNRPFDPEWNFRLYFVPIIQAPEWAKKPLFGGKGRDCCCW